MKTTTYRATNKDTKTHKVISAIALFMLLVAIQVSTQDVGDWFVFGLNILEANEPYWHIANVSVNVADLPPILLKLVSQYVPNVPH